MDHLEVADQVACRTEAPAKGGALTIVGLGIQYGAHVTPEARGAIAEADIVLHIAPASIEQWLLSINTNSRSLAECHSNSADRRQAYDRMVDVLVTAVRSGLNVCAAFYGHPGVFVDPTHRAARQLVAEGYPAVMLPGISADACLFADLLLDPGEHGCQSFDATDFVASKRLWDPRSLLLLWQVGSFFEMGTQGVRGEKLGLLANRLSDCYAENHQMVAYEAARYPSNLPKIERLSLGELRRFVPWPRCTLVVPPKHSVQASSERSERA